MIALVGAFVFAAGLLSLRPLQRFFNAPNAPEWTNSNVVLSLASVGITFALTMGFAVVVQPFVEQPIGAQPPTAWAAVVVALGAIVANRLIARRRKAPPAITLPTATA